MEGCGFEGERVGETIYRTSRVGSVSRLIKFFDFVFLGAACKGEQYFSGEELGESVTHVLLLKVKLVCLSFVRFGYASEVFFGLSGEIVAACIGDVHGIDNEVWTELGFLNR